MTKQELLVDFIISLDGYAAAEGWPGWWGLEGPEYLTWLGQAPERDYTILMGANTYRQMYGFASRSGTSESDLRSEEESSVTELTNASKVVFSSTLQPPLSWPNTRLISEDAVEAVRAMKREGDIPRAISLFREALALNPAHEDSRYYLANCLLVLNMTALLVTGDDCGNYEPDRLIATSANW